MLNEQRDSVAGLVLALALAMIQKFERNGAGDGTRTRDNLLGS